MQERTDGVEAALGPPFAGWAGGALLATRVRSDALGPVVLVVLVAVFACTLPDPPSARWTGCG